MPIALSVLALLVGVGLWVASLVLLSRANRGERLPYLARPRRGSGSAIACRAAGAGLIVFGVVAFTAQVGHWGYAPLLGVILIGATIAGIAVHNRAVHR